MKVIMVLLATWVIMIMNSSNIIGNVGNIGNKGKVSNIKMGTIIVLLQRKAESFT